MSHDATRTRDQQSRALAHRTQQRLVAFVQPLLCTLNHELDVGLVRTFLATLIAIVQWRNRAHGLLLSELGAYLASPQQAPAGTKRLSRLLASPHWSGQRGRSREANGHKTIAGCGKAIVVGGTGVCPPVAN